MTCMLKTSTKRPGPGVLHHNNMHVEDLRLYKTTINSPCDSNVVPQGLLPFVLETGPQPSSVCEGENTLQRERESETETEREERREKREREGIIWSSG